MHTDAIDHNIPHSHGTPKSSILMGFSLISHPFLGYPHFGKPPYDGSFDMRIMIFEAVGSYGTHVCPDLALETAVHMAISGFADGFRGRFKGCTSAITCL